MMYTLTSCSIFGNKILLLPRDLHSYVNFVFEFYHSIGIFEVITAFFFCMFLNLNWFTGMLVIGLRNQTNIKLFWWLGWCHKLESHYEIKYFIFW